MPRLRAIQWMLLLDVAYVLRNRWERLGSGDRRRLAEIVRKGYHLSDRDKHDLRRIVSKLELIDAGREIAPIIGRRSRKRGKR